VSQVDLRKARFYCIFDGCMQIKKHFSLKNQSFELKLSRVVSKCFLYFHNKNHAYWVKNGSGTNLFRKSFKNGCCRRQKQNCELRIARCFGQVLIQITSKDHWDSFPRLLRAEV
jgi:hypothetical protein